MHKLEDLIKDYIDSLVIALEGIVFSLNNLSAIAIFKEFSPISENRYLYAFLDDFRSLCLSRIHSLLEELESFSMPKKPYESASIDDEKNTEDEDA